MKTLFLLGGCALTLATASVHAQSIDVIQKDIAQVKLEKKLVDTDIRQEKKELNEAKKSGASSETQSGLKMAIANDKKELNQMTKEESQDENKMSNIRHSERVLGENGVAQASIDAFRKDFGDIHEANWVRGNVCDEVTFTRNGQTLTAYYDDAAKMIGTSSKKKFTDLPALAQQRVLKDYKGYDITDVLFFDRNTSFGADDNYFVGLQKDQDAQVLQVGLDGSVRFYCKR